MITRYSDHITTDKEEQKEIVELYNKWYKDTMFLSSWLTDNKYWDELENYCMSHKDLAIQFWIDMKHDLGDVGHFTYMLQKIMPGVFEPQGYIPLNIYEQIWLLTLTMPRIESIDGQSEDLVNDPKTWEPITMKYKTDWWEEQLLTEETNVQK